MGLLAEGGETPFVGTLSFFSGASDSTSIVLTVSLANRALRFRAEGDRYRASYDVALEVRQGTELVKDLRSREVVRVLAFRETTRDDESVLFRQVVNLAPGTYDVRLTVRDESAPRGSAVEATIGVPQFIMGTVSSPTPVYEARPREDLGVPPDVLPTPRSTAVFGRDSVFMVYAEGYGQGDSFPVHVLVRSDDSNALLWSDTIQLARHGDHFSSTFPVPIARLGVGVMTLGINHPGSPDTVSVPLFVAFGEDLPVATFPQMLDYLRYFVSAPRLEAMRNANPEGRAALWAAFLRRPTPSRRPRRTRACATTSVGSPRRMRASAKRATPGGSLTVAGFWWHWDRRTRSSSRTCPTSDSAGARSSGNTGITAFRSSSSTRPDSAAGR